LKSVKRLKDLKIAVQKSYNASAGKEEKAEPETVAFQPPPVLSMSSTELSDFIKRKIRANESESSILSDYLSALSSISSELSINEEECLALGDIDHAHEVQTIRIAVGKASVELSDFLDTEAPPMIIAENEVNADSLYSTVGNDGHSIETLMFYSKSISIVRSIAKWPGLQQNLIVLEKLEKMSDEDISNPKKLRTADIAPSVLIRIGFTALDLLRAGYSKQELKIDGKISPEVFWECLLTLRDELVTVSHCLSIGFTLKDLQEAGFESDKILEGISETNLFTPSKRDTSIRGSAPKTTQQSITGYTFKNLKEAGLDCDRYALSRLYLDLDGHNWRRSDNWMSDKPIEQWLGVKCEEIKGIKRVLFSHLFFFFVKYFDSTSSNVLLILLV